MIALFIGILLQLSLPTIAFAPISSATPYVTATPVAAPVISPNSALNQIQTLQAQVNALPTQIAVQNNQIYMNGRPLLPKNEDMPAIFGYGKWALSSASYSLTGPLAPITIHVGIFVFLAIASLLFKWATMAIVFIYRATWWLIDKILRLIPFIG